MGFNCCLVVSVALGLVALCYLLVVDLINDAGGFRFSWVGLVSIIFRVYCVCWFWSLLAVCFVNDL